MSLADPYLVTPFVHPQPPEFDPLFDPAMHPAGYVEFISRLGLGNFCDGLIIETAESRRWYTPELKEETFVGVFRELGAWEPGVLETADLIESMVIARSDEGDTYLTCPRFGRQIFELPRHHHIIRPLGENINDLLIDYAKRYEKHFSYFDTWPNCSRRASIGFVVQPEMGFERLLGELDRRWGVLDKGAASRSDPDFFQDRFIPKLHAHIGFWFKDQRPPEFRLPEGSISVSITLDIDFVTDAVDFARPLILSREARLTPNVASGCKEHALG